MDARTYYGSEEEASLLWSWVAEALEVLEVQPMMKMLLETTFETVGRTQVRF
jgi:hypothetical protein